MFLVFNKMFPFPVWWKMKVLFFQMEEPVHSNFPVVDFPRLILSLIQHVLVVYFFSQLSFTRVKRDGAFLLVSRRRML